MPDTQPQVGVALNSTTVFQSSAFKDVTGLHPCRRYEDIVRCRLFSAILQIAVVADFDRAEQNPSHGRPSRAKHANAISPDSCPCLPLVAMPRSPTFVVSKVAGISATRRVRETLRQPQTKRKTVGRRGGENAPAIGAAAPDPHKALASRHYLQLRSGHLRQCGADGSLHASHSCQLLRSLKPDCARLARVHGRDVGGAAAEPPPGLCADSQRGSTIARHAFSPHVDRRLSLQEHELPEPLPSARKGAGACAAHALRRPVRRPSLRTSRAMQPQPRGSHALKGQPPCCQVPRHTRKSARSVPPPPPDAKCLASMRQRRAAWTRPAVVRAKGS